MCERGLKGATARLFRSLVDGLMAITIVLVIGALLQFASADCSCGYSTTIGNENDSAGQQQYVFTDLIESNFAKIDDILKNTDWVRQAFNLTAQRARGNVGEMFAVGNIETSATSDTGLQLTVRSSPVDGMVSGAEIDTERLDVFYGSFRSSMRLTNVTGTVSAFFWYFNDTQEIDMEFLSKDFHDDNSSYPVNLVLQSHEAAKTNDASNTPTFQTVNLPFNPTTDFHEYRIDFIPNRVIFYADGQQLAEMTGPAVPTSAGHMILQHWSNGNPLWSGGPPAEDATISVRYVKAYFNSSTEQRQADFSRRCVDASAHGAVCAIPAVEPGNKTAADWFFSDQKNMTDNQTVSGSDGAEGKKGVGPRLEQHSRVLKAVVLILGGWMLGL